MLNGIVMDIINMPVTILLVANTMIPEAILPYLSAGQTEAFTIFGGKGELDLSHYP